jgi:hypothetical protein
MRGWKIDNAPSKMPTFNGPEFIGCSFFYPEAGYELEVRRQSPNALLTDEGVSNVARTLRSSGRGADTLLGEDDVASLSTLDSCRHGSRSMDAFARPYVGGGFFFCFY